MGRVVTPLPPATPEEAQAQLKTLTSKIVDEAYWTGFLFGAAFVLLVFAAAVQVWR